MHRILITGDIHIGNYSRYNFTTNFRINQFDRLAERFNQMADEYSVDHMIIAGDILRSCINQPKIEHRAKEFFDKISEKYNNIEFILGNHDVDSKSVVNYDDSLLTILCNDKIHYMNDKLVKYEDCSIYYHDWYCCDNVTDIKQCDLFISHINLSPRFGQTVDESKFRYGVFGDYHSPIQVRNMYSTSTPIQHYISDPPDGSVILVTIDGSDIKIERVQVANNEYKFLRIYNSDDAPAELGELDAVIRKNVSTQQNEGLVKISNQLLNNKSEFMNQINDIIEQNDLVDIHKEVIKDLPQPCLLDYDFKILNVEISNYRSIESINVDFTKLGKLIFLSGLNGSGKSSFINGLITAMLDDIHLDNHRRIGSTGPVITGIELLYDGSIHKIRRFTGGIQYSINGNPVAANSKKLMKERILQNLPFLYNVAPFFIKSRSVFFSNFNRVDLFTKLFHLDVLSTYRIKCSNLKASKAAELNKFKMDKVAIEAKISTNNENKNNIKLPQLSDQRTYDELNTEYNNLSNKLSRHDYLSETIKELESKLVKPEGNNDELNAEKSELLNRKDSNNQKLSIINDKNSLEGLINNNNSLIEKYNKLMSESTVTCDKCGNKILLNKNFQSDIDELKNKNAESIEKLNKLPKIDLSRTELLDDNELIDNKIKKIDNKINENNDYYNKLNNISNFKTELNNLSVTDSDRESLTTLERLKNDRLLYDNLIDSINKIDEDNKKNNETLIELTNNITNINTELNKYDKYDKLFDISYIDSIPCKLLSVISDELSTDDMKFSTTRSTKTAGDKFFISCSLLVDGNWIDFDQTSDGQQARLGIMILSRLTNLLPKLGLVILDEPLRHIDSINIDEVIELIKNINSEHVIISSHAMNFSGQDSAIEFELVNGVTRINTEL